MKRSVTLADKQATAKPAIDRPIGLTAAVPSEGDFLIKQFNLIKKAGPGPLLFYTGRSQGRSIVYVVSGIGKTNAAHATTCLIHRYNPAFVINFGIGGAYPASGLKVGDIAIAAKEIYADEGVKTKTGFKTLETIGIPALKSGRKKYFNEFPLDKQLLKAALKTGAKTAIKTISGVFTTVSTCSGETKRADEIHREFGAVCENMEGAAVAHICRMYQTPCVEIRGISNMVGDRDIAQWDIPLAALNCGTAVLELIKIL